MYRKTAVNVNLFFFNSKTVEARIQFSNIFIVLKDKTDNLEFCSHRSYISKTKEKKRHFKHKKPKEFIISRTTLEEYFKKSFR